jgi:peptide deformylase
MNSFLSNDIKHYPHPILNEKSLEVVEIDHVIVTMARNLQKKMKELDGDSISAIKIGIPARVIVVRNDSSENYSSTVMINPKLIESYSEYISLPEKCLCLPGVECSVTRPRRILVEYVDLENNLVRTQPNNEVSRLILHELDHLDGKIFVDLIENNDERDAIIEKYRKEKTNLENKLEIEISNTENSQEEESENQDEDESKKTNNS